LSARSLCYLGQLFLSMKILVVEDDALTAEALVATLADQNYTVETAADGEAGWQLIEAFAYDLILLDVTLPKLDGISLCQRLRSRGHQMPILLLTARNSSHDKAIGLDAGADDYLVKPFNPEEIAARIRALLRRNQATSQSVLEWGDLQLDPRNCEVTYGAKPLSLTAKEYALLELLLRNSRRVFSCGAILENLWSFEEIPSDEAVRTHIKGLRQKLKAGGAPTDLIETVYGIGYRLKQTELGESSKKTKGDRKEKPDGSAPPTSILSALTQVSTPTQQQTLDLVGKVWERFKERVSEQVAVLEQAVAALDRQEPDQNLRQQAKQEAHTLAGSLGTFGLAEGSQLARRIEQTLKSELPLSQTETVHLGEWVRLLRQEIGRSHSVSGNVARESAGAADRATADSLAKATQATQATQATETDPHHPAPEATPEAEPPLLLIVDRDRTLANQLIAEAPTWGLRAEVADNLTRAKDKLLLEPPDVVLLDPAVSPTTAESLSLLAAVKKQAPPIPVVIFTEHNDLTERLEVARLGGKTFLQKSAPSSQVFETINQVLHQAERAKSGVMVVDDDPKMLAIVRSLLEPWGLRVTTLADPQQFWQVLEATTPDLLILDVEMPQMSGIELCQIVRNDARWSGLPIVFLTAHTDADTVNQVFSVGADDFVSKPIVGPELVTRIINRLERIRFLQNLRGVSDRPPVAETTAEAATEAFTSKDERLRLALAAAQMGTWDWNLLTHQIIWSEEQERLFGLAPGTFDGTYQMFDACLHPDDRESLLAAVNQARQQRTDYSQNYRVVWPDGSIYWIESKGKFFYNEAGEPVRMLGTTRDISPRKQAEVALQIEKNNLELRVAERTAELLQVNKRLQSELEERKRIQEALQISQARFAGILDIAEDAIISIDRNQHITLFNQGAEKIFGYSADEVSGQPLGILLPLRSVQAHWQHVDEFGQSTVKSRRMGERREIFGRRKDGSEFPAEASISKLNLDREVAFTVFLQDITDRKQIDRMKDEFVSVVSHELRTPLTSIHGSLGMLASGLLKADSEQGKRMLHIAVDSTDRLVRLINDILDIERIESGKVSMEKQCCNVDDLVTEAINVVQGLADKVEVTLAVSSLSIHFCADPDRIVQTLTNLLSNAIKFSTAGKTVWLTVQQQDHHVLFRVQDEGRGIPADKLESIFERFQQVDSSDSRNHEGTGLGLAICRSIVQQHDGQIWAESVLGEGSTFYFTIPIQACD
jgi:PAS domain S-box-containing protein